MTSRLTAEEPSAVYKALLGQRSKSQPTRLGDVLTVIRGVTYKKEQARQTAADGLVPLLRASNIQQSLTFDDLVFVPASCVSEAQHLRAGDIVVAASSGSRSIVGKAAPLKHPWSGSFGAFCFALRPNAFVNAEYLAWFMQSPQYRGRVAILAAGVNINNLRTAHIEETVFPLPSVGGQREIVSYLDEQLSRLDASVAALLRAQANLKRYRASVLKAACEGRLVPTEAELAHAEGRAFEAGAQLLQRVLAERRERSGKGTHREPEAPIIGNLSQLPQGWTWARFDALADIVGGLAKSGSRVSRAPTREVPYLRVANVQRGYLDLEEIKTILATERDIEDLRLQPGDVLFNEGGDRDKLGRGHVWNGEIPEAIHQNHVFRARADANHVLPTYLSMCGNGYGIEWFSEFATQSVNLASMSLSTLRKFPIALPPLAEQHRIVAETDRRLSLIRAAEAQVTANRPRQAPAPVHPTGRLFAGRERLRALVVRPRPDAPRAGRRAPAPPSAPYP